MNSRNNLQILPDYWYKTEEASGTTSLDRGFSGTAINGTITGATVRQEIGRSYGYLFDADSELVDLGTTIPLASVTAATLIVRFKQTGTISGIRSIFMVGKNVTNKYGFGIINDNNTVKCETAYHTDDTTIGELSVSIDFDDGLHHTIALVYSGTNSKTYVYVDGRYYGEYTCTSQLHASLTSAYIGDFPFLTSSSYRGVISDVRIYLKELKEEEIKRETFLGFNQSTYAATTNKVMFWNQLGSTSAAEKSNIGASLTEVGTVDYVAVDTRTGVKATTAADYVTAAAFDKYSVSYGCITFTLKKLVATTHTSKWVMIGQGPSAASQLWGEFYLGDFGGGIYKMVLNMQAGNNWTYGTQLVSDVDYAGWSVGAVMEILIAWNTDGGLSGSNRLEFQIDGVPQALSVNAGRNGSWGIYSDGLPDPGDMLIILNGWDVTSTNRCDQYAIDNVKLCNFDLTTAPVTYTERPTADGMMRMLPNRVVYWNKFGSVAEAEGNPVGGSSVAVGTPSYATGKFGNGFYCSTSSDYQKATDVEDFNVLEGAIEFWLTIRTASPLTGTQGLIYFGDNTEFVAYIYFNGTALTVGLVDYTDTVNTYANYTYDVSTSFDGIAGTHKHIGVTYNKDGGLGGGTHTGKIALRINGTQQTMTLVSSRDDDWTSGGAVVPTRPSALYEGFFVSQTYPMTDLVMNNLKIHNYAKVNFSDREVFEPINSKEIVL